MTIIVIVIIIIFVLVIIIVIIVVIITAIIIQQQLRTLFLAGRYDQLITQAVSWSSINDQYLKVESFIEDRLPCVHLWKNKITPDQIFVHNNYKTQTNHYISYVFCDFLDVMWFSLFLSLFLAALAALYLTLVSDWWVSTTLEFWHKEWLLRLQTLETFVRHDV